MHCLECLLSSSALHTEAKVKLMKGNKSFRSASPDVLVIGGGAVGASCALELTRAGARVTLIERGVQLGAGCSAGSAGIIATSHAVPIATPSQLRLGMRSMLRADGPIGLKPRLGVLPWLVRFAMASTHGRARSSTATLRALNRQSFELHSALPEEGVPTGFKATGVMD